MSRILKIYIQGRTLGHGEIVGLVDNQERSTNGSQGEADYSGISWVDVHRLERRNCKWGVSWLLVLSIIYAFVILRFVEDYKRSRLSEVEHWRPDLSLTFFNHCGSHKFIKNSWIYQLFLSPEILIFPNPIFHRVIFLIGISSNTWGLNDKWTCLIAPHWGYMSTHLLILSYVLWFNRRPEEQKYI